MKLSSIEALTTITTIGKVTMSLDLRAVASRDREATIGKLT